MKHNSLFIQHLSLALFLFWGKTTLAQRYADCDSAYWVGNTYAIRFGGSVGIGSNDTEAAFTPCFRNGLQQGQAEANSIWLRFDIEQSGRLSFSITPDVATDDYDFVLYRLLPNGDCKKKEIVRCMAAGVSPGETKSPCMGVTGLREKSKDKEQDAGCSDWKDDAWLSAIDVASGECYVLLVSNVTAAYQGFSIRFKGSCTFKSRH